MEYVYRYLSGEKTIYVGITNNLKRRIEAHKHDKLQFIKNQSIECFAVNYREDAEILEEYLINHYETGNYFNIKKVKNGKVSFIGDIAKIPWQKYDPNNIPTIPFVINNEVIQKTLKHTEYVTKVTPETINATMMANKKYFDKELNEEKQIISHLIRLYRQNQYQVIAAGVHLHYKRYVALIKLKKHMFSYSIPGDSLQYRNKYDQLLCEALWVSGEIDMFESELRDNAKRRKQHESTKLQQEQQKEQRGQL